MALLGELGSGRRAKGWARLENESHILAKARCGYKRIWIPACAGMTEGGWGNDGG